MAIPPVKPNSRKHAPKSPPKRPPGLAHGRWLGDFPDLSAAERALVAACGRGEPWEPEGWDGETRPEEPTPENTISSDLIRFLALGGDAEHPVHEQGVMVRGAWIAGVLTLHQASTPVRLAMRSCHFAEVPNFLAASLPELSMRSSKVPGLDGDRLEVQGGLFLDNGFAASGEVRLPGARIGGNLECSDGTFANPDGIALNADGITVTGNVFLNNRLSANGAVRLLSARIGGNLECSGGTFANSNGIALNADRMAVRRSAFFRNSNVKGAIWLGSAKIGTLIDGDLACWQSGGHVLDGLQYDRIVGATDSSRRIAWLQQQRKEELTTEFAPQPWEQLIKVLREMGHPHEASEVAIAKQVQMRAAGKIEGRLRKAMHWLYGALAGYGYRPMRTVAWMAAVWLAMGLAFWAGADRYAAFGPANPAITSAALYPDAAKLCGHGNEPGMARWTECSGVPDEYSTFQPFIYSLDLILPLVDLQQETDWAPIAEGPTGRDLPAGVVLRWLMWFEILFGWAASLMLVAVLGRLVERD